MFHLETRKGVTIVNAAGDPFLYSNRRLAELGARYLTTLERGPLVIVEG